MKIQTIKSLTKISCTVGVILFNQLVFAASPDTSTESPADSSSERSVKISDEFNNTLLDFSDKSVQFEDYIKSNQWTVVMFWASDCHVCNVEAHQYVKLHTDYQNKNIRVLGISVDGKAKKADAREFIKIHNINFPNLIAELDTVANLYNQYTSETWIGTPTFMIFSPEGKVMAQRPGMLPTELIVGFIENQTN